MSLQPIRTKSFINRLHLVLHAYVETFDMIFFLRLRGLWGWKLNSTLAPPAASTCRLYNTSPHDFTWEMLSLFFVWTLVISSEQFQGQHNKRSQEIMWQIHITNNLPCVGGSQTPHLQTVRLVAAHGTRGNAIVYTNKIASADLQRPEECWESDLICSMIKSIMHQHM